MNAAIKDATSVRKSEQTEGRAGNREAILFTPENLTDLTSKTEQLILASASQTEYVSFGGVLSQLLDKEIPYTHVIGSSAGAAPKVPVLEPINEYGVRSLVERVAVFQIDTATGSKNIGVPTKIIETLIQKKLHAAPKVTGLVTHPMVLPDGSVVCESGLHEKSGLLLHGSEVSNTKPYSRKTAIKARRRLMASFLDGFEFAGVLDAEVALAGLFTGVVRRVLDQAPGFAFLAPIQSSGKTTLARRIHVILTGRDMPVSNFAAGDENETQKRLLAMLLSSPAMVCLDNVTDGTTFASSAISMVMTSPVFKQRVLGLSREAECPTNVLMVATGNNLSFGADELTRWLPANLMPKSARPQERVFKNPDVVAHALQIREDTLRDVIGIVSGYLQCKTSMATASRFTNWDRMVRQSLMWAGGQDVAQVFRNNADNSEVNGAAVALLISLRNLFGTGEFGASQVAGQVAMIGHSSQTGDIAKMAEALSAMHCKDPTSPLSVGRAMQSIKDRRVPTRIGDLTLKRRPLDGLSRYSVV